MRMSKIFYTLIAVTILSSCGLENMASKYNTVDFTTSPAILEVHGGKVALSLEASFPEKYFSKQATVDFTPVLIYNGGETAFKTITIIIIITNSYCYPYGGASFDCFCPA